MGQLIDLEMKKTVIYILASAAAIILAPACQQLDLISDGIGALTARLADGAPATKTSFDNIEGKLLWNEGDQIAVHYSDGQYRTLDLTPQSPATTATVAAPVVNPSVRDYYAVYPASAAVAASYGNTTLKVHLPSEYDITDIIAGATGNPGADYAPLPMVAVNDPASATDALDFYHVGGLLRIILTGIDPTTQKVRVTLDKDVTGDYVVADPGTTAPSITTAGTAANNVVTFTLAAGAIGETLAASTIFLNVPVPCGTYDLVTVECLDNAATPAVVASQVFDTKSLAFGRHHGKKIGFGTTGAYDYAIGVLSDATVAYDGGVGSLANAFVSYKTPDSGTSRDAVPFTLEYSEDGGATWSATPPTWLTPGAIDTDGSVGGQDMSFTAAAQVNSWVDPHHIELAKDSRAKSDFDLSTYNVATGATVARTTANCYVVSGSGTYKFPLVYGNGVKSGAVNESAYRGRNGVDGEFWPDDGYDRSTSIHYLGSFKDHLDQNIYNGGDAKSSPYLTTHLGKNASDLRAVLIWQDVEGLVEVNPTIAGTGEDAYLTFSVPSGTITQGNAMVAVLTGEDVDADGHEDIAWSWHIWVTEEDLTQNSGPINGSTAFMPVNIGWCEGRGETYATRSCQVRATQAESGYTATATLTQEAHSVSSCGNAPYYVWGRKDPIQANLDESYDYFKPYYPSSEEYTLIFAQNGVTTLGRLIQHPYVDYIHEYPTSVLELNTVFDKYYINLWSSAYLYNTDPYHADGANMKTKTIYDPSPSGFRVAAGADFACLRAIGLENLEWVSHNGTKGYLICGKLFLPAMGQIYIDSQDVYGKDHTHSIQGVGFAGSYLASIYNFTLQFMDHDRWPYSLPIITGGRDSVRPVLDN